MLWTIQGIGSGSGATKRRKEKVKGQPMKPLPYECITTRNVPGENADGTFTHENGQVYQTVRGRMIPV